jgi:hypothetical protein
MPSGKIPVFERAYDRIAFDVTPVEAARMVRHGQARWLRGRGLRLTSVGERLTRQRLECRTHTSRGGVLAAIGRSQEYVTHNAKRAVDGFKTIYPEDRHFFELATCPNGETQ